MTTLAQDEIGKADVTVYPGNLQLPAQTTQVDIYVSVQSSVPAFSLNDNNDPCYTGGVTWNNLPDETLTITFHWAAESGIQNLSSTAGGPNLGFGTPVSSTQTCTVQANCCGDENFEVIISGGKSRNALFIIAPAIFAGNLVLPPRVTDIYVSIPSSPLPAFSLSESSGPYYSGGIAWNNASGALSITFNWSDSRISDLASASTPSNLSFGSKQGGATGPWTQTCTVQPVGGNDSFNVNLSGGQRHDPIIVVTPINAGPPRSGPDA
jgi:hypothetical protein